LGTHNIMEVYSQALGMAPGDSGREVTQQSYCEKLQNAMYGMIIGETVSEVGPVG
jgi:hypothetical protein